MRDKGPRKLPSWRKSNLVIRDMRRKSRKREHCQAPSLASDRPGCGTTITSIEPCPLPGYPFSCQVSLDAALVESDRRYSDTREQTRHRTDYALLRLSSRNYDDAISPYSVRILSPCTAHRHDTDTESLFSPPHLDPAMIVTID